MAYNLQEGSLIKRNYVVRKVLFTSVSVSVYLVFDKKITGKSWIAKEFSFDSALTKEDIAERRKKLSEAIESLKIYDHKNIAKIIDYFTFHEKDYIIMEYVEGITFEEYIKNSTEPLPEGQIIKWAAQICRVLHYFNNRPNPYIFGILDPTRIMSEQDGAVKLINYGLNRFFGQMEPVVFSNDKIYFSKELNSFGFFLIFLATKIKTTDMGVLEEFPYSDELKSVIKKCLDPKAHIVYGTFEEIEELFDGLIKKGEAAKVPRPKPKTTFKSLKEKFSIKISNALFTFSLQKIQYQILEITAFLILLGFVYALANPTYHFEKKSSVIYLLSNEKEIICVNPRSYKIIDKIILEMPVNYIQSDAYGRYLYLSTSGRNMNKIFAINCENNKLDPRINITVDIDPQNILVDERSEKLYVLNKASNNISVVDLKANKMTGIIPVGKKPTDIKDFNPRFKPFLFVSNSGSGTVSVINKIDKKLIESISADTVPYSVTPSNKEERIFVACQSLNYLKAYAFYYDLKNELNYTTSVIEDTGGKKPVSMYLDKGEKFIYIVNAGTNNVSVIDLSDKKLKKTVYIGKDPAGMVFIEPNYLWIINKTPGTVTILNTYTNAVYKSFFVGKNLQCITYAP